MNTATQNPTESGALARSLTCRYGALALSRAAGEAAAADRQGDQGRLAFLRSVIADLRQTMAMESTRV